MTSQPRTLSVRLKDLGFTLGNQMKLYGQRYQIDSEPMVVTDGLVLVDAIEMKSGDRKRSLCAAYRYSGLRSRPVSSYRGGFSP